MGIPGETEQRIVCPYCGLTDWVLVQPVNRRDSRGSLISVMLCRCNNCGRVFYVFKYRFRTITYKLEDLVA
ncbi:MAG: hypothetical protein RXQ74_03020 [Caldivirga sp.]|jgi:uncharacterized Zn finger protein|uniref:hypothetical protein n=1 Tax=Caldivirga sp. MU80 TaxID=1650354 RepID=UPI0008368F95|nr:hypothetical protein [Caldivirga sp. MU80]